MKIAGEGVLDKLRTSSAVQPSTDPKICSTFGNSATSNSQRSF
jgi:hypothetical protein